MFECGGKAINGSFDGVVYDMKVMARIRYSYEYNGSKLLSSLYFCLLYYTFFVS